MQQWTAPAERHGSEGQGHAAIGWVWLNAG
jgi:hypothetical protein